MSDAVSRYLLKYPHARTSTLIQIRKEEDTLHLLRAENHQEIGMQAVQRPAHVSWWRRVLSALKGEMA